MTDHMNDEITADDVRTVADWYDARYPTDRSDVARFLRGAADDFDQENDDRRQVDYITWLILSTFDDTDDRPAAARAAAIAVWAELDAKYAARAEARGEYTRPKHEPGPYAYREHFVDRPAAYSVVTGTDGPRPADSQNDETAGHTAKYRVTPGPHLIPDGPAYVYGRDYVFGSSITNNDAVYGSGITNTDPAADPADTHDPKADAPFVAPSPWAGFDFSEHDRIGVELPDGTIRTYRAEGIEQ